MFELWSTTHGAPLHPIAKISKVKDLALILFISVFSLSSFHLLQKVSFYSTYYSQPFNETFIFSGKSCCCNDTFANFIVARKEYLTSRQIISRYFESVFHELPMLSESFVGTG